MTIKRFINWRKQNDEKLCALCYGIRNLSSNSQNYLTMRIRSFYEAKKFLHFSIQMHADAYVFEMLDGFLFAFARFSPIKCSETMQPSSLPSPHSTNIYTFDS